MFKFSQKNYFFPESKILRSLAKIKFADRIVINRKKSEFVRQKISDLEKTGYAILPEYIEGETLSYLQERYRQLVEKEFNFDLPCLAQTRVDREKHRDFIDKKFRVSLKQLEEKGLTFNRNDFSSYEEALEQFRPSTLKTLLPHDKSFLDTWLDPKLLEIIKGYLGLKPYLLEAYLRRNFPAEFKVMNHYWHRDTNSKFHLVKAFFFLNDCTLENGPHEYVSGSIQDGFLNGKTYYPDEEVDSQYPPDSPKRIKSVVKAGTVIIEDTRGLHRASLPISGHRDMGYAVFVPKHFLTKINPPYYQVPQNLYDELTQEQRSFIPQEFIC